MGPGSWLAAAGVLMILAPLASLVLTLGLAPSLQSTPIGAILAEVLSAWLLTGVLLGMIPGICMTIAAYHHKDPRRRRLVSAGCVFGLLGAVVLAAWLLLLYIPYVNHIVRTEIQVPHLVWVDLLLQPIAATLAIVTSATALVSLPRRQAANRDIDDR